MKADAMLDQDLRQVVAEIARRAGFAEEPPAIEALLGDGSDRRFFRLRCRARRAVVLISPRQKRDGIDENDSYLLIGRHLFRHQLPVPRIHWADPAKGHFVLEDLGDFHLQAYAARYPGRLFSVYRRVVRLLVELHRRAPQGFNSDYCFDNAVYDAAFVYRRELEYFREGFLNGYLGLEIGPEVLRPDFEKLAEAAGDASRSHVIHRDYQSRNLMIRAQALRLIDFQGMRFGPPAYDLASVLIDPYVRVSHELERELVALYWMKAGTFLNCSFRRFLDSYGVLRLCRNLQILGAFGYLGVVRGKPHFLRYIPQAWKQLHFWLNSSGGARYPEVRRLVNEIHQAPLPGAQRRAERKVLRDKHRIKGYKPLSPDGELD